MCKNTPPSLEELRRKYGRSIWRHIILMWFWIIHGTLSPKSSYRPYYGKARFLRTEATCHMKDVEGKSIFMLAKSLNITNELVLVIKMSKAPSASLFLPPKVSYAKIPRRKKDFKGCGSNNFSSSALTFFRVPHNSHRKRKVYAPA